MHIEFYKANKYEYARLRTSERKSGKVGHGKGTALGRVLDKERLIFKSRLHGTYQYDPKTGEHLPPPADFSMKVERGNAKERLIVDFGNVYLVDRYIANHGLWPVFEAVGYGNPDSFRALLNYYILETKSNAHAECWYMGSYASILYPQGLLSSPRISDMLKALGDEKVYRRFFSAYISYLKDRPLGAGKGSILIDSTGLPNDARLPVTAVSNHNGEISREVRLIYVVQHGTGMPIYMRYVPGNIVDISTLMTTMAELKAMAVDTEFAILDAGYLTLDSMPLLLDQGISFLARVRRNWGIYKEIVSQHLASLECEDNLQRFNGRLVFIKQVPYRLTEKHTVYCYLGLDDARRGIERLRLGKKAEEEELEPKELFRRMSGMGVFMLVCSRPVDAEEILPLYYSRQDIEQVFDITKGYANALPLRVQSIETFRGHLLMVFCATVVLRFLQQDLLHSRYSLDSLMGIMRNQKAKVFDEYALATEATKEQKELYNLTRVEAITDVIRSK